MVIGHAQFLTDPFGKEIRHVMVFGDLIFGDGFIEKPSFFGQIPIDRNAQDTGTQILYLHVLRIYEILMIEEPVEIFGTF